MTHRLTAVSAFIGLIATALALAPGAFAASEQGDAGDLRASAQDLGSGPVDEIAGSFSGGADADLYRLCLTDGRSFSATTIGGTVPANFDTQLFLFDADGFGVYANDDGPSSRNSRLPADHRFSPGTGGEYFLAVSPYNHDPQSEQGEIFADDYARWMYPDGVLDANGFGAAGSLDHWNGRWPNGAGEYRIALTGTTACVPPDTTPPAVDLRSPADGARVPRGANVVVDFSCSDEGSSGLASCVGSVADGAELDTSALGDVSVTVTARDGAGNETVARHTVTVIDETAPEITLSDPVDGAVYRQGEQVAARYSCDDEAGGSGIDSCAGDVADGETLDTSTLGEHTFKVEAADRAGNRATKSSTYTVVDETAPQVQLVTPADGAVYTLGESAVADYSCADEAGGSGIATCSGTVANGSAVDTSSIGEKSFTVQAADVAGNPASVTVKYTVVDRSAPTIELTAPAAGAVYALGQRVVAAYSCTDQKGGSGVATCEGTVAAGAPIDTSTPGEHTFEVRAVDVAGNTGSRTVTYSVAYPFDGFLSPVDNLPETNRWKAGVPVPIRFSLDGYRGARPEAAGYPLSAPCGGGEVDVVARASKKKPVFHYERRSDRYWMLWKTERKWAGSCREFVLKLDDGTVHKAQFEFSKR